MFFRWIASGLALIGIVFSFHFTGCGNPSCKTTLDCPAGQYCVKESSQTSGVCEPRKEAAINDGGEEPTVKDEKDPVDDKTPTDDKPIDDNKPTDNDPVDEVKETVKDEPPPGPAPQAGELVINEILYSPPTGNDKGDANKDGARDTYEDEFIEIVNVTDKDLYIAGVKITDDGGKVLFTVPEGVLLAAKQGLVVFGGGMAADTEVGTGKAHSKFGGSLVYITKNGSTSSRLSLTNSGKVIVLKAADDTELGKFEYGAGDCPGGKSESVTLNPDMTGTCILHSKADTVGGTLFSPGTRVGGLEFSKEPPKPEPTPEPSTETQTEAGQGDGGTEATPEVAPEPVVEQPTGNAPAAGDLVINEVHADPDSTNGDANKDGTRETYNDEFIEIVNVSSKTLQLAGLELYNNTTKKHVFPGLSLPPRGVVVIFGGGQDSTFNTGQPSTKFSGAYVYTASGGNFRLSNSGATVSLKNAAGTELASFTYGTGACNAGDDQSVTLDPELTGTCVKHSTVTAANGALFSPGTKVDGTKF